MGQSVQCCTQKESASWETPLGWKIGGLKQFQEIGFSSSFLDSLDSYALERRYEKFKSVVSESHGRQAQSYVHTTDAHRAAKGQNTSKEEDCIHCVMRGSVSLSTYGKDLGRCRAGQCFSVTRDFAPSVVAITQCVILSLTSSAIHTACKAYRAEEQKLRQLWQSLASEQRKFMNRHIFAESSLIRGVGFSGAFLDFLADGIRERSYATGQTVADNSSTERMLFAVSEGTVAVHRQGREVSGLSSGELFGFVGDHHKTGARLECIAGEQTSVLMISSRLFTEGLEKFQEERNCQKLQEAMDRQLHAREVMWDTVRFLQRVPGFRDAGLTHAFINSLAEDIQTRPLEEGQLVFEQNGFDRNLYVLLEGVCIEYKDGREQGNLVSGLIFGQAASLSLHERQATTVVANTRGRVVVIPQRALVHALDAHPGQVECLKNLSNLLEQGYGNHEQWTEGLDHPWAGSSPKRSGRGSDESNRWQLEQRHGAVTSARERELLSPSNSRKRGSDNSAFFGNGEPHSPMSSRSRKDRSHNGFGLDLDDEPGSPSGWKSGRSNGSTYERGSGYERGSANKVSMNAPPFEEARLLRRARFGPRFCKLLAQAATRRNFSDGSVILRRGASCANDFLCYLKSGSATMTDTYNREVAHLNSGDLFGSGNLDESAKHVFQVKATEKCVVEVVSFRAFYSAVEDSPEEIDNCEELQSLLADPGRNTSSSSLGR